MDNNFRFIRRVSPPPLWFNRPEPPTVSPPPEKNPEPEKVVIDEEIHEYIWDISNHGAVISSANSLATATREFSISSLKHGVTYKWQVGYKMVNQESFTPYLRLLSPISYDDATMIRWELQYKHREYESWIPYPFTMEPLTAISNYQDRELVIPGVKWSLRTNFILHSNDTKWRKLRFALAEDTSYKPDFQNAFTSALKTNMGTLLGDTTFADLQIVCSDGVELRAHQAILCAQNPVFASMLTTDMVERTTGVLNVEDISGSTMKILLHFLYTGDLLEDWSSQENIWEMMYAAGKYQLTDVLKLMNNELGKDEYDYGELNTELLVLASRLSLRKAENRFIQQRLNPQPENGGNGDAGGDELVEVVM